MQPTYVAGGPQSIFAPGRLNYILTNHGWSAAPTQGRFYPQFSNPAAITALAAGAIAAAAQNPALVAGGNQPNTYVISGTFLQVDEASGETTNVNVV